MSYLALEGVMTDELSGLGLTLTLSERQARAAAQRAAAKANAAALKAMKAAAKKTAWGYVQGREKTRTLNGLGASPAYGSRAWWQWYATVYLPQRYSQQQIYQYVYASPYYQQFGSPFQYQQYGQYGYDNPYFQQAQAQYTQWQAEQLAATCAQRGGYFDYAQQSCYGGQNYYGGTQYGTSSQPPNVIGMPIGAAIAALNGAGFNVWLLNQDGISQGVPPGYSSNRVSISVANGIVNSSAVG